DAVVVFGMGSANPGIVAASPNVSLDLQGIPLEKTVQYLGISGNDRGDDRVVRVYSHPDFGQPVCNLAPKLITDGCQIDRAYVDRDTVWEVLIQATNGSCKRIINDAVEESVGHHRKLCFQINKAVQRQYERTLPA
ncbi:MAG: hypothetical protein ACK5PT_01195, partial [Cereibacter sp.]